MLFSTKGIQISTALLCVGLLPVTTLAERLTRLQTAAGAAILKEDRAWSNAAAKKKTALFTSYYTSDAVLLSPNEKTLTTRAEINKSIGAMMALPKFQVSWTSSKVSVARSGEMGYVYGTYKMSFGDGKGGMVNDHGKFAEVWKKQASGKWKCAVDMFNTDLPAAQ